MTVRIGSIVTRPGSGLYGLVFHADLNGAKFARVERGEVVEEFAPLSALKEAYAPHSTGAARFEAALERTSEHGELLVVRAGRYTTPSESLIVH